MSRISVEPFRFSDYRALKVNVYFGYAKKHDSISLSFRCKEDALEVISTSVGQISEDQVLMKPVHEVQLYVDHCESDNIQCIVGYYEGDLLQFSDILIADLDRSKQIESGSPQSRSISTKKTSFDKRLQDFTKSLETLNSDWQVSLTYTDDMALTIDKKGSTSIVASFGEMTDDLRASDYLFSIDPGISMLHIPKEIVFKTKKGIDNRKSKRVAIFELVTPDFVELQNFYKIPISNTILLSEIK